MKSEKIRTTKTNTVQPTIQPWEDSKEEDHQEVVEEDEVPTTIGTTTTIEKEVARTKVALPANQ